MKTSKQQTNQRKQPARSKEMSEASINAMNEIFPGFGPWYRAHYTWQRRLDAAEATEQREASAS